MGNLRDVDYDFRRLWLTGQARRVAREAADGCFCTHECSHYASTIYNVAQTAKIAVRGLWKDLSRRRPAGEPSSGNPERAKGTGGVSAST